MGRFQKITGNRQWLKCLSGQARKSSLFRILVIPFVVLLVIIVGLNSYVSYKTAQNAVSDSASQLMTEIGKRIDQNLSLYMLDIEKITRTNASLVQSGLLVPGDLNALRQHFWAQLHTYELASTVALGTEKRDFMALEKDNLSFILREYDKKTRLYTSYRLNEKAAKTQQTVVIENYDPLNDPPHDPWYAKTRARGRSSWMLVVTMAKGPDNPELMIVNFLPIYDKKKNMMGVAASSIYLSQFGRFLTSLKIGQTGQAFVIDRQGNMIATSTGEIPFRQKGDATYPATMVIEKRRIAAVDSRNALTSAGMKAILSGYGNLDQFSQSRHLNFSQSGVRYLMQVIPIKKGDIDWLTVIIVPETDFMALINQNARYNILFSGLALLAAIMIGIFTVRRVTAPLRHLNTAAKRIAAGEWDDTVTVGRSDEIGELAGTFNSMAAELKASFALLQKEIVERKQMEAAISASEERFRRLLQDVPAIAVQGYRLDGTTTYWNHASERLYGYTQQEALGRNLLDLIIPPGLQAEVEESIRLMTETGEPIPSAELSLMRKDGSLVAVFSNHALVQVPGSPPELFCLDIDLSERVQAETALQESEEKYRNIFENAVEGIFQTTPGGRFLSVNPALARSYGYESPRDMMASVTDIGHQLYASQEDRNLFEEMINTQGQVEAFETQHYKKDGDRIWISVNARAVRNEKGAILYYEGMSEDITNRKEVEKKLKDSEYLYRTILDSMASAIYITDRDLRLIFVNKQFNLMLEEFGLQNDIAGQPLRQSLPFIRENACEEHLRVLETGKPIITDDTIKVGDREYFTETQKIPILEEGRVIKVVTVIKDLSDIKQSQILLAAEKNKLQSLIDSLEYGLTIQDREYNIIYQNEYINRMFGNIGKKCYRVYEFRENVCEGCPVALSFRNGLSNTTERTVAMPSGNTIVWENTATPIRDAEGNITACLEITRDITERKLAEEMLRASEELLSSIVENIPDMIFIKDAEALRFVRFNKAGEKLLGYQREELIGKNDYDFFPRAQADFFIQKDRAVLETGEPYDIPEEPIETKSGRRILHTKKIPILDKNGKPAYLLGISGDITEHKLAEEEKEKLRQQLAQSQKMESIGTLAGGIAHDFNNILSAIMGYTDLALMDAKADDRLRRYLHQVYIAGERARDLVKQILAFSRQSEQQPRPLSVSSIIEEVLKLLRASLPATITIRQDLQSEPDTVLADPTQIHQIMMNLCTNAAHAMRETKGELKVGLVTVEVKAGDALSIHRDLIPGMYLKLTVSDTGVGIAPDVMGRIFDPFFTTKMPGEGTGMGLSVVHGIARSYHGTITVESEVGKGTAFHVYLPLLKETQEQRENDDVAPVAGGKERILFVDDEEVLVQLGVDMLTDLGYELTAKTSSLEALRLFQSSPHSFDLVITDMTMPDMTGIELSREIMLIRPEIPVILCTGFSEAITAERAKALGLREFIMKPIIKNQIAATIRSVLDQKDTGKRA